MSRCRTCSASIFWAVTRKPNGDVGARMPVDMEPVADGNIEVVDETWVPGQSERTPVVRVLKKGEGATLPGMPAPARFVSHFSSCPDADQHRR